MNLSPKEIPFLGKLTDNMCLSGGARGADVTWGNHALNDGHEVVHWSFDGHKSYDKDNTYILTAEELEEADEYLKEANLTLKRRLNFKKIHVMNLLRRNWYQVKYADSVYVVGTLNEKAQIYNPHDGHDTKYHITNTRDDRMGVNGGTGWACQMYLDRYRRECGENRFYLMFFDQIKQRSFVYSPDIGLWVYLYSLNHTLARKPCGVYAGIGTRDINIHGEQHIETLFHK